jgi:hypothetical protein
MSMLNSAIIQRRDLFVSPSAMLFGPEWPHAVARSLGPLHPDGSREAIDSRLVRRWASGKRVVPIWVISALAAMLKSKVTEVDAMRIRLSCAETAIAVELQEFSVDQETDHDIRVKHTPSADEFLFVRDGHLLGRCTHVSGSRIDPDDPEIDLLAESARHVAREHLRRNRS